jgi:hypothetical protein
VLQPLLGTRGGSTRKSVTPPARVVGPEFTPELISAFSRWDTDAYPHAGPGFDAMDVPDRRIEPRLEFTVFVPSAESRLGRRPPIGDHISKEEQNSQGRLCSHTYNLRRFAAQIDTLRFLGQTSRDPDLPRELRIVFEKSLLPLEFGGGGLHSAVYIGSAGNQGMFSRRGAFPLIAEKLPRIFAAGRI